MKINNEQFSTRRIEALSDGVFAIAMTLLVISLNTPVLQGNINETGLWSALLSMRTQLLNFTISFLMLGSIWAVHMRQFEYIKRTDRHLAFINTLRLFVVVLIPFSTSLAGNYPNLVSGRILLPINFFVLALITTWQWWYATRQPRKFSDHLTELEARRGLQRDIINLIIAFCVIILTYFIGTLAFLLFIAVSPILALSVGDVRRPISVGDIRQKHHD